MLHTTIDSTRTAGPTDTASAGDVVDDFAAAARSWPERPAIVHNGVATSYREVAERVDRTAAGVRASSRVGVLVSHTPAVVEQLLGILAAGAAYCPVDAALPDARKQSLAAALGVDHLRAASVEEPGTYVPTPSPRPSDAAYVLCTSGSTGTPKPVVVSRESVSVTVRALRRLFTLTPDDRVLQFASLGWDTCLEEILPALTSGAALVFDDAAHSRSFPAFVRMLREQRISVIDLPTAFWHELVLFLHEEQTTLPDSVRLVIIGGERIDPTRLQQWRELDPGRTTLLNTYGCTETTMITHAVQLSGPGTEPDIAGDQIPMGRPLAHVRDHLTADGELLVSGPGLATGYLGLPEVTAAAFPLADHGGGMTRWFRTGDVVSRDERGLLYPRGRTDEEVKVLGVRIHPAEVEDHLNSHPAVGGAVVTAERSLGRTILTAYVVATADVTPAELKAHVRGRLPAQFVPNKIRFVAALSFTASGKVDRAATRRAAAEHDDKGAIR